MMIKIGNSKSTSPRFMRTLKINWYNLENYPKEFSCGGTFNRNRVVDLENKRIREPIDVRVECGIEVLK